MEQPPGLAVERVEPAAFVARIEFGVEQFANADVVGIGQFGSAVICRAANRNPAVLPEFCRGIELGGAFIDPAWQRAWRMRHQIVMRIFVQQDGHRKIGLATAHADRWDEGSRGAGAGDIETSDVVRIVPGELADLARAADHEHGQPVRRAGHGVFAQLQHVERCVIAFECLTEFLHVLPAIIGIDHEMIGFGDMPVGVSGHGEKERCNGSDTFEHGCDPLSCSAVRQPSGRGL